MNNIKNKELIACIIDPETGEVTDKLFVGDRIIRANQVKRVTTHNMKAIKNWGKLILPSIVKLVDLNLTSTEYQLFFQACLLIGYEDNILYDSEIKPVKPINKKRLLELSGVSENTFDKSLNTLIKNDVIKRVKNGRSSMYILNPYLFYKGKNGLKSDYELFKHSKFYN